MGGDVGGLQNVFHRASSYGAPPGVHRQESRTEGWLPAPNAYGTKCPLSGITLKLGIEEQLKIRVPGVKKVVSG